MKLKGSIYNENSQGSKLDTYGTPQERGVTEEENSIGYVGQSKSFMTNMMSYSRASGPDLGNLVGETTGSGERDLTKSHENMDSKVTIPIQLIHIPGIKKWQQ